MELNNFFDRTLTIVRFAADFPGAALCNVRTEGPSNCRTIVHDEDSVCQAAPREPSSSQLSVLSARGRATSEGYLHRTLSIARVNTVKYVL